LGTAFWTGTAFFAREKTALKNQRCRSARKKPQRPVRHATHVDFRNRIDLMGIPRKNREKEEKMTKSVKTHKSLARAARVRIEYTVCPTVSGYGFKTDKKLLTLKILLNERFGEAGQKAYLDWLLMAASLRGPIRVEELPG
jgi:hypothetical protein